MHKLLARINDPEQREQGFTLIELLVVIIIIGILSAIAIPIFLNQKKKAASATTKSDVRNAVSVVESALTDNQSAAITGGGSSSFTLADGVSKVVVSTGNTLKITGSGTAGYCIVGSNANGSPQGFYYDSSTGATTSVAAVTVGTTTTGAAAGTPCNGVTF